MPETAVGAVELNAGLIEAAAVEGKRHSRTAQQQLEHWVRVGRLLCSGDRGRLDAALAGELPLHAMTGDEQAVVNAEINAAIEAEVATGDFSWGLPLAAVETVALNQDGRLVRHHADGTQSFLDGT